MRSQSVEDTLAQFEQRRPCYFWPHEIAGAFYSLSGRDDLTAEDQQIIAAEIAAWELRGQRTALSPWGTYYHPLQTGTNDDGTVIFRPDIQALGDEALTRWEEHSNLTNPFLRARYADLRWDLTHKVRQSAKRDFIAGQIAIDAYLEQASSPTYGMPDIEAASALERALQIASELNDSKRIDKISISLLQLANAAALEHIGVWTTAPRCFLGNRKIGRDRLEQLIEELERRLKDAADIPNGHACEASANSLLKIYKGAEHTENRTRVLRTLATTFEAQAANANASVAIHWLLNVVDTLESEGLFEDANRLRLNIEQRGTEALSTMTTVSTELAIDRKELEESIDETIHVEHPFKALFLLALRLRPKCDSLRTQVKKHEKDFVFYSLFHRTVIGHDGLPIASIGSSDTDMDGRMVEEAMHTMALNMSFFEMGYQRAKKHFDFTPTDLTEVMSASYLCPSGSDIFISESVKAYDSADYIKAISILVPQIEVMLRELLKLLSIPVRKGIRRSPGFSELKNMNDILSDPRVENVVEEDLLFFLRIVFIDKRGWNLRNEFAHGALPVHGYNHCTASAIMMSLLLLAVIGPHGTFLSDTPE